MVLTASYTYQRGLRGTQAVATKDERLLVLFLGTDETAEGGTRADTIMLLSLDVKTGEAGVLSIPRAARVWIPYRQRWERVTAASAHGGASMAMEAASL